MKYFLLLLIFFTLSYTSFAQREKYPTYFGIHFKPVIPSNFVGSKQLSLTKDNYNVTATQTLGYSFGVTIRSGITKLIAFESGLNYTLRNYNLLMTLLDTNVNARDTLTFINYEIPLNALFYVQLDKQVYMNASMGVAIRFAPTSVVEKTMTGGIYYFDNFGYLKNKVGFNLNANFGFEYRTKKRGFYYLGGSICVPLSPIFYLQSTQITQQHTDATIQIGKVDGSYLGIDFKYFFPIIHQKGEQPLKGPIE